MGTDHQHPRNVVVEKRDDCAHGIAQMFHAHLFHDFPGQSVIHCVSAFGFQRVNELLVAVLVRASQLVGLPCREGGLENFSHDVGLPLEFSALALAGLL